MYQIMICLLTFSAHFFYICRIKFTAGGAAARRGAFCKKCAENVNKQRYSIYASFQYKRPEIKVMIDEIQGHAYTELLGPWSTLLTFSFLGPIDITLSSFYVDKPRYEIVFHDVPPLDDNT